MGVQPRLLADRLLIVPVHNILVKFEGFFSAGCAIDSVVRCQFCDC